MGDLGSLSLSGAYVPTHDTNGTPLRAVYKPKGPKGWAGVYWQQPANNWGDRAGQTGYDLTGARKLTFWMRGEHGGEKIREVRVGGIVGRYPDSDVAVAGPITLTKEWQRFEIDLSKKDLKHIIGGFGFSVNKYDNVGEVTFYIDDVAFELPSTSPVAVSTPVAVAPAPKAPVPMTVPASPSKEIKIKSDEAGLRVSFSSQLLFSVGKTTLRPESAKVLKQVSEILKAYPKNNVLVEGHTDSSGNAEYNLELSRLRAQAARDALVKNGGFDVKRFTVVGYGQTHPIADNATKSGRALNRRVEIVILKTEDKL
jgi:outer membrane protein OmpA-like peptidoglycan-associated protein